MLYHWTNGTAFRNSSVGENEFLCPVSRLSVDGTPSCLWSNSEIVKKPHSTTASPVGVFCDRGCVKSALCPVCRAKSALSFMPLLTKEEPTGTTAVGSAVLCVCTSTRHLRRPSL